MEDKKSVLGKKGIVFVADAWGEFKGGIDVFNQKLCEAMGYVVEQSKVEVICLVIGIVETAIIDKYRKRNICIIEYNPESGESEEDICNRAVERVQKKIRNTEFIWIGHDIKTGPYAYRMAQMREEKSAVIFHTSYFSYKLLYGTSKKR